MFLDAIDALDVSRSGDFDALLRKHSKLAALGEPWENTIKEARKMHHVGEITLQHNTGKQTVEKVWEFKHADLRILWCYGGPGRVILFANTFSKDQRKIDKSAIDLVEKEMQRFTSARESGKLRIAGGKENERTFGPLFPKS